MTSGSATNSFGTATAFVTLGLLLTVPPTACQAGASALVKSPVRVSTSLPAGEKRTGSTSSVAETVFAAPIEPLGYDFGDINERQTSAAEKVVGELRRWAGLSADWDGEGAMAPNGSSISAASKFVQSLPDDVGVAEPMLHASGLAGLFWHDENLYADLEFLGDGRIAYFVQNNDDRHKGVVRFDEQLVPPVLHTLLAAQRDA